MSDNIVSVGDESVTRELMSLARRSEHYIPGGVCHLTHGNNR
mgnify:CR=1 FL=1